MATPEITTTAVAVVVAVIEEEIVTAIVAMVEEGTAIIAALEIGMVVGDASGITRTAIAEDTEEDTADGAILVAEEHRADLAMMISRPWAAAIRRI